MTDGLVAMWDGEWNIGMGKHDSSAIVWKDLVGGHKLTLDNGGSWGTNCLRCSGTARAAYGDNMTGTAPVVVEAVFKMNNIKGSWETIWHQGGWATSGGATSKPTRCIIGASSTGGTLFSVKGQMSFLTLSPMSIHVEYDGDTFILLKCNLQDVTINQFSTSWYVRDGGNAFVIGGKSSTANTYAANLNFYSLRLYSRALTEKEIQHNYLIDKVRFNLP